MVSERMEVFVSIVKLRACDGGDIEAALTEALTVCADLMLDGEVIALQRVIAGDSDKFPDIAETFFHKAITPTQTALANWLRVQQKRGTIVLDDADNAAGMLLGIAVEQGLVSGVDAGCGRFCRSSATSRIPTPARTRSRSRTC